jgi:CRP-like cAMP-binding protein
MSRFQKKLSFNPVMKFKSEWLIENDVFAKLKSEDLEICCQLAISRRLESGEFLSLQDDIWPYLVFVKSGRLRWMLLSAGGKEHQLFTIDPGEIFWTHSFFDDKPMPASLRAAKKTHVYLWNREYLLPILYRNPVALFEISRLLTGIMRRAREIIYGLAFQPLAGRLANFIISSLNDPDNPSLARDMTLDDIAAVCATSSEVVCRLLYQFQSDGLLEITRTTITITDQDSLKQIADFD